MVVLAQRLLAIVVAVVATVVVGLSIGLIPPELAAQLSEKLRGGSSAGDDQEP